MEFFAEKYYKMLQDVKGVGVKNQPDKLIEENSIKCKEETLFTLQKPLNQKSVDTGLLGDNTCTLLLDMLHWLLLETR